MWLRRPWDDLQINSRSGGIHDRWDVVHTVCGRTALSHLSWLGSNSSTDRSIGTASSMYATGFLTALPGVGIDTTPAVGTTTSSCAEKQHAAVAFP